MTNPPYFIGMLLTDLDPQDLEVVDGNLLSELPHYKMYKRICFEQYLQACERHSLEVRDYQPEIAALYCTRHRNLCAGSQGLGKNIISGLAIYGIYFYPGINLKPGTVHIIAPTLLSATTRWFADLQKLPALEGQVEVIKNEGQLTTSTAPVWVYHMDFLKRKSKSLDTTRPYVSRLIKKLYRLPSMVVVDEVHHYRKGSDRYNQLNWLLRKAKRTLALSGTISDGRLDMVSDISKLVYKNHWPFSTGAEFNREFGTSKAVKTNYLLGEDELLEVAPRYLPHLSVNKVPAYYELASRFVHRVTLNDPDVRSAITLPTLHKELITCEMDDAHATEYRNFVRDHLQQLQAAREYGNTVVGRSRALSILEPLIELSSCYLPNAKLIKTKDLVLQAATNRVKTVVFVNKVKAGRLVTDYLKSILGDFAVVRLYAADPEATPKKLKDDAREEILSRFLFDPEVFVGVMSINLAGESIDLTQASQMIFYDLPWQTIRINQALSRCERPGAIRDWVNAYFLCHAGTIDLHMYNLAMEKTKQSSLLLDYDLSELITDAGNLDPVQVIDAILNDI